MTIDSSSAKAGSNYTLKKHTLLYTKPWKPEIGQNSKPSLTISSWVSNGKDQIPVYPNDIKQFTYENIDRSLIDAAHNMYQL